jgi:hypothetical protein
MNTNKLIDELNEAKIIYKILGDCLDHFPKKGSKHKAYLFMKAKQNAYLNKIINHGTK